MPRPPGLDERAIAAMREGLLSMIDNLARDEALAAGEDRRMPSTREMARRLKVPLKRARRTTA